MPQSPLMTSSPSPLALVPFVSVEHMMKIVNTIGLQQAIRDMAGYIEADLSGGTVLTSAREWPPIPLKV